MHFKSILWTNIELQYLAMHAILCIYSNQILGHESQEVSWLPIFLIMYLADNFY